MQFIKIMCILIIYYCIVDRCSLKILPQIDYLSLYSCCYIKFIVHFKDILSTVETPTFLIFMRYAPRAHPKLRFVFYQLNNKYAPHWRHFIKHKKSDEKIAQFTALNVNILENFKEYAR